MILRLKHLKRVRAKGRTYWYHRITGERLPDGREDRAARVLEINRTMKGTARKIVSGSLSDIIAQYKRAPEYRGLAEKTRYEYGLYMDVLSEKWGPHPVASIERRHILKLRDLYADTAGKANKLVGVLRILLTFAIERDYRRDNPAKEIKKLAMGAGHSSWPVEAIERFLETAPPMMALALKLGLYSGQRQGDVLAMSWNHYDGERIQVVQSKTGTKLSIPVHSALREALDTQERVSPIILTTETGRPFTGSNFRHHFGAAQAAAGLTGMTFHGLRYTAAKMLAEAGCRRLLGVRSDAAAMLVHEGKVVLSISVALLPRPPPPLNGLRVVPLDTQPARIHVAKIVLADHMALFRRQPKPRDSRAVIPLDTVPISVHGAQPILGKSPAPPSANGRNSPSAAA